MEVKQREALSSWFFGVLKEVCWFLTLIISQQRLLVVGISQIGREREQSPGFILQRKGYEFHHFKTFTLQKLTILWMKDEWLLYFVFNLPCLVSQFVQFTGFVCHHLSPWNAVFCNQFVQTFLIYPDTSQIYTLI